MCSKNADTGPNFHPPVCSGQRWSLTGRLNLFVSMASFTILFVAVVFLYAALSTNLEREDREFLAARISVLRAILDKYPRQQQAWEEEVLLESAAFSPARYFVRVLDDAGTTLMETPGMERLLPVLLFLKPPDGADVRDQGAKWKADNGKTFMVASAWGTKGKSGGDRRLLQVALEISDEEKVLAGYRRTMAAVLVVGLLAAILVCRYIVRQGMQPLTAMTRGVELITASRLHDRLGPADRPSELNALAGAFDTMLDRLEESFLKISRYSADLAHEMRTPLNALLGTTEIVLSKERTAAEYRQVIEASRGEYERLARTVESLLFLARAENNEIRIERSTLDAGREIEAIREFFEAQSEEQGVELICRGEGTVCAEPLLLRRALANLVANALRFTPAGGTITMTVTRHDDGATEIVVADTGAGISPEHLAHLFDRFYKADPARSPHESGTGLGLAIVRSIMELHGGTASLQSRLDEGTTVTLRFPAA